MKYVKHLECTYCNAVYPADKPMNLCPQDHRPVQMKLDVARLKRDYPEMSWYQPKELSMWRFGPLLPFDIAQNSDQVCSLGEGYTPLIDVSAYVGFDGFFQSIFIKDEGQPYTGFGENPTASFKDRGMSVVTTMAKYFGLLKLVVPTQGNAGDSLCEYGHHFGLQVAVVMPDNTPLPILGKVAAYNFKYPDVELALVSGTIREAGLEMKQRYLPEGYFNCATFQEPGWRIEGKKTLGLELAEPNAQSDQWELPDVIFYPTGGGTGILGMWKAFDELQDLGIIDHKRPRIIAVQSDQNAPVVEAFQRGDTDTTATNGGDTLATGLNVPGGVGHAAVLSILKQSNGSAMSVSEQEIAKHTTAIYQQFGMWISPEGAATVAAVIQAKDNGIVAESDRIVCFNTGSAEKYLTEVRHLFFAVPEATSA